MINIKEINMATPYITLGSPTTGGGKIISGDSSFIIDGKAIACVGDKATCPKHKCIATILAGDNHMIIMGKPAAVHNSPLSCGCKCIGDQHLVVGDNGGGSRASSSPVLRQPVASSFVKNNSEEYGHQFQLKDQLTGEPLVNVCYEIIKNGEAIHGTTDENGFTELVTGDSAEEIELNVIAKDHDHD